MIVTYLSEESERANVLARLGFSYGIGMVFGPILGGYITSYFNEQTASLIAALGSLLSIILVLLFIPHIPKNSYESRKRIIEPKSKAEKSKESKGFLENIAVIGKLFCLPGVGILLTVKLIGGVPIGILQSMFSLIAIDQFGMKPEQNGMMLSYIGLISLFMQGIGIATLTKGASDKVLMMLATMTLMGSYFVLVSIKELFYTSRQIEGKTRQNAENKQTLDFSGKIEIEGKNSSKRRK